MTTTDRHWVLPAGEFSELFKELGRDRLPYPLRLRRRAQTQTQLENQCAADAAAGGAKLNADLALALDILANPRGRVEVYGLHGADERPVRVHAGVAGRRAAVAEQAPGEAGDITVRLTTAAALPEVIASLVPPEKAGERQSITVAIDEEAGPLLAEAGQARAAEERDAFFRRARTSLGEITAFPGASVDSRPTDDGIAFHWADYDDDGRYLIRRETHAAAPADQGSALAAPILESAGEAVSAWPAATAELVEEIARSLKEVLPQA